MANSFKVDKYKSVEAWAYIASLFLIFTLLLNFLFIVLGVINLANPNWQATVEEGSFIYLLAVLVEFLSASELIILWIGIIFILIWLHRSFSNLSPLKARDLEFSPGWAVGWWFIPFANLFKPYQAVAELWRESDPDFDVDLGYLSSSTENPLFLGIWWGFWIFSNITARITTRLGESENPEIFQIFFILLIVSSLFTIVAGSMLIYIIFDITKRQERRFEIIGESPTRLPPPPTFDRNQNDLVEKQDNLATNTNDILDSENNFPTE